MTDEETARMADLTRKLADTAIDYKKRCEELEKACAEWAEVSQSNYQRAKSAEAKLAQAQTWQPIETAPKDGTTFFAYWPDHLGNGSDCVVTTWFGPWATGISELVFQTAFEWGDESSNPTHWMPHAAPPAPPTQDT
jgi:hypothetical protein